VAALAGQLVAAQLAETWAKQAAAVLAESLAVESQAQQ